jgi:hypothetical protein
MRSTATGCPSAVGAHKGLIEVAERFEVGIDTSEAQST